MPKQRPPFDHHRYEELKAQGLSQRAIAEQMGMPEATLRNNLRVLAKVMAQSIGKGLPVGDQGLPPDKTPEVHRGSPAVFQQGLPDGDNSIPPLYVHPGIPDDSAESPVGAEDIEGVHQGVPALPLTGIQQGDQGPPQAGLSPQLVEALNAAWPDLQRMLEWWRERQRHAQEPAERLERATYHVAPKWIEAVRCEVGATGDTYAAVVNRAFAQYFAEKSARGDTSATTKVAGEDI